MIEVRYRKVVVRGAPFSVPTNVSRVTSSMFNGWQVRFANKPERNKFFPDEKPTKASINSSFLDACEYADKYRPKPRSQHKAGKGVRLVHDNSRGFTQFWWEVSQLSSKSPKRFYVGTENTATQARFKEIEHKALKHRDLLIRRHAKSIAARHAQSKSKGA